MMHDNYWGYRYPMHSFWGGGILDTAFTILFWIALIFLVVTLVKGFRHGRMFSGMERKGENALDILKQRYAKGELTKKEFVEMKKDIE